MASRFLLCFFLASVSLLLLTSTTYAQDDKVEVEEWDSMKAFHTWESMQGTEGTLVLFILPFENRFCSTRTCLKKRNVVDQIAQALRMDDNAKVAMLVLPEKSNDIGSIFGPTLKLAHSMINEPSLLFGIGLQKTVSLFQGKWDMEEALEAYVAAKVSDQPLDDTECLNNDLDDIAMLALDRDADLDQLIKDTLWHMEIMDGFELECANIYLSTLRKIKEKGGRYVSTERKRLAKLVSSRNTSRNKKIEMQRKMNVLGQFEMGGTEHCQGPMCGDK
eukprot:c9874_g1_i1.p1 GENE.c9874_g1_i1~~c9874_g1_i1.p1  ORF type:complete len:291 (-),score=65.57 c9874_g1_i1:175-1002(-)